MSSASTRLFTPLLRLLFPARGGHRSAGAPPGTRGEPHRRRLQRQRRRALWLAVQGYDVGPRRIHGVEVASG